MKNLLSFIGIALVAIAALLTSLLWSPIVGPWAAERKGQAEFRRAEQNRQIKIEEAKARQEAAQYLAEAEVTKAHGVAKANSIMAESLGGPEGYLRWKYIDMLEETGQSSNTIIYIPTEGAIKKRECESELPRHVECVWTAPINEESE